MDKKSLIGLGLIAAILITWLALTGPSKEQIARNKQIKDSIELATKSAQIAEEAKAAAKKIAAANDTTTKVVLSDSLIQLQKNSIYKDFAVSVSGKKEVVTIENENIKAFISTKGGNVEKVILKNYKRYGQSEPLVLFDADSTAQYLQFEAYANNMRFTTDSFYFKPSSITETVSGNSTKSIILKLETSNPGSYIEYIYSLKGNDYMLDYDVNFVGMQNILSSKNNHVTMHWSQALPSQEKHITKEREAATAYFNQTNEGVDYINARKSEEKLLNEDNIKWISFKQHFFNSTLIADGEFLKEGSFVKTSENPESKYVKTITAELSIPFKHSSSEKFGMSFYFGPTQYNTLKAYDLDLEKIIPLGWSVFSYINKWMIIPLFSLLSGLNSGIIILILTLILKTLLFPIAYKTYMSSAKMRVLKPEIDELNANLGVVTVLLNKKGEGAKLKEVILFLQNIQRDLFKIGAELASLQSPALSDKINKIDDGRVGEMEECIDRFWRELPELKNFILPGGSLAGTEIHRARTICRRAERQLVEFSKKAVIRPELNIYLNRLSDFLFALARWINARDGVEEIIV